ncbi:hypothetical protein D3C78_1846410 [compost metagenome]
MMLEKGIRLKALEGKPEMTGSVREDTRPATAQRKFNKPNNAGGAADDRKGDDKPWKKKKTFGDKPKFEGKKDRPFEKRGPKPAKG